VPFQEGTCSPVGETFPVVRFDETEHGPLTDQVLSSFGTIATFDENYNVKGLIFMAGSRHGRFSFFSGSVRMYRT
jgi:hypothetical protein